MPTENTKAADAAQPERLTRAIMFLEPTGYAATTVSGHPVEDVMPALRRLLDGTTEIVRALADDGNGHIGGTSAYAIFLMLDTALALHTACMPLSTEGVAE